MVDCSSQSLTNCFHDVIDEINKESDPWTLIGTTKGNGMKRRGLEKKGIVLLTLFSSYPS